MLCECMGAWSGGTEAQEQARAQVQARAHVQARAQVQPKAACGANGAVMLRPGADLDSSSVQFGKSLFCGGRVWEG